MSSFVLKNLVLILMVYSCALSVILIAYFGAVKGFLIEIFKSFSKQQRFLVIFAASLVVSVVLLFALLYFIGVNVETNLGQVGDFVGGILNPLLSFMAFIAILVSISVQEKDISVSIDSLKEQEKILRVQAFESSFFNLLSMLRERRAEYCFVDAAGNKTKHCKRTANNIMKLRRALDAKGAFTLTAAKRAHRFVKNNLEKMSAAGINRQFFLVRDVIESGSLSERQKKHYYKIFMSDLDSYERAVLVNNTLVLKMTRKLFRKHGLVSLRDSWIISPSLYKYYNG
ncbi:hypothetical protein [Pseudomonas sp. EYE_354]|uniref:hypothetical protein n=1 Tax=Pseudomonas sp. EYE_354 TaxID=2853449 RepID=UPI00200686BC|nr:hypothetical protein [Pseudomonas sp. EYE_354]MCK6186842.1 hypothetical protein [Pseudomonas sp. EYE_354]